MTNNTLGIPTKHNTLNRPYLQINLNRSKEAYDAALVTAHNLKCHSILMSEPNKAKSKPATNIYCNSNKNVSIVNIKESRVWNCSTSDCHVQLDLDGVTIFNVYISPNCSLLEFCRQLDIITTQVHVKIQEKKKVIVCGDFNAKHTRWGGKITDVRGRQVLESLEGPA